MNDVRSAPRRKIRLAELWRRWPMGKRFGRYLLECGHIVETHAGPMDRPRWKHCPKCSTERLERIGEMQKP